MKTQSRRYKSNVFINFTRDLFFIVCICDIIYHRIVFGTFITVATDHFHSRVVIKNVSISIIVSVFIVTNAPLTFSLDAHPTKVPDPDIFRGSFQ